MFPDCGGWGLPSERRCFAYIPFHYARRVGLANHTGIAIGRLLMESQVFSMRYTGQER